MGRAYFLHLSFFLHLSWTQFAEISNLHTHLTLRNLRPANTRKRAIPYGYGFSLVSCPNYFFEAVAWGVICVMTGSVAGTSFSACSLCSSPSYPRFMFSTLFIFCSLAPLSLQLRRDSLISFLAFVFTGLAVGQMALWAIKKHKNYKKDFGKEYPRGRKAMFPFVL